jgi:3-phytase
MQTLSQLRQIVRCLVALHLSLATFWIGNINANAAAASPPAGAAEAAPLSHAEWLAVEKRALKWIDATGKERAKIAVRGKQLDARVLDANAKSGNFIAVMLDSDANQPIIVRGAGDGLRREKNLPEVAFSIEAICLGMDAQRLVHLFLIGKEGIAEQWILHESGNRLFRTLALPPHAAACRVDDASFTLFVSDHEIGVWAFDMAREGSHARQLIAQRAPQGKLKDDAGTLSLLPNGAVAIADGARIFIARPGNRKGGRAANWQLTLLPAGKKVGANNPIAKMAATTSGGKDTLWTKAKDDKDWRAVAIQRGAPIAAQKVLPIIMPRGQTETVARYGDAADDPAIWIHPTNADQSRVLGTNKKQGLLVYDLNGKQTQLLEVGRINNVDVRQSIQSGGRMWDLAAATQRDENSIVVFSITADGMVKEEARIATDLNDIYGMCAGRSSAGDFEVYANDKDGRFIHTRIQQQDGKWSGSVLRRFKVSSQPEGCVVDEKNQRVFVGEEKKGVWTLSARPEDKPNLQLILPVSDLLVADVEGLAIYENGDKSYLVISSQGNDSYVVIDSRPPYQVRGAFRIGINIERGIDGASETDGIEVTSRALNKEYARGMLVVQDGYKRMPNGPQNFKYIAWDDIAAALKLP